MQIRIYPTMSKRLEAALLLGMNSHARCSLVLNWKSEGQVSFGRKNNVHGQFKPHFYIMSNVSLGKISDF